MLNETQELLDNDRQTEEEVFPPLTIKLVNMMETNWVKEGTERTANPERMAWPGLYRVIPTSVLRVGKKHVPIRHIYGCESIDPKWQDENGYIPNPERDNIWLVNGTMTFLREGSDIGAYDYIKAYQGNVSNPNRPKDADDEYEEVIAAKLAKADVVEFSRLSEAIALLDSLRVVEKGEVVYEKEMVAELVSLLNLDASVSLHEQFVDLQKIAMQAPERIVNSISNPRKRVVLDIKKADELNLLLFDDNRIVYAEGKEVLIGFKQTLKKEQQIKRLAEQLTSSNGKARLDQLRIRIQAAEEKKLSGPNT